MTTLVGRKVWAVNGSFIEGTVIKQRFEPDVVTIKTAYGDRHIHSSDVRLNLKDCIKDIDGEISYWQNRMKEVEEKVREQPE